MDDAEDLWRQVSCGGDVVDDWAYGGALVKRFGYTVMHHGQL